MSWPSSKQFGITDNPLLDSPFIQSSENGQPAPPLYNEFLLLNGSIFGLLNGGDFLLLNSA